MNISYRTGRKEDCPKLAELVYIASDGVVEFLFHDLINGVSSIRMVAHNLEKDSGYYTYKNTIVAEEKSGVIGVSFYYPARYHVISDEMRSFFPADRIEHLKHILSGRVENSLYIDTLCVDENFRGSGIGGELVFLIRRWGVTRSYTSISSGSIHIRRYIL